jgi:hypothetical protein
MTESMTLGEALPHEMARVRDELLPMYDAIPTGVYAATMMRADLDRAAKALAEGDVVAMLRVYESLKGFTG